MPSPKVYTIVAALLVSAPGPPVDTLASVAALPPYLAAQFRQPDGFVQLPSGDYLVADRRGHTVYLVGRDLDSARAIVRIGTEPGNILQPFGFDVDVEAGLVIVGDSPGPVDRVQVFETTGSRVAGFTLPPRSGPRLRVDGLALNAASSLHATSRHTVLLNQPEFGSLITEYDYYGRLVSSVGHVRATGHENDRALHLALNTGFALAIPSGGYYFVFQAGEPRFLRFAASGALEYARAIQGPELDQLLRAQPETWPTDATADRVPLVTSVVRAAAVDAHDRLWVSFAVPYAYVYGADGERERTVQFRAAGILEPTSLSFAPDGRLLATPGCYVFRP